MRNSKPNPVQAMVRFQTEKSLPCLNKSCQISHLCLDNKINEFCLSKANGTYASENQ